MPKSHCGESLPKWSALPGRLRGPQEASPRGGCGFPGLKIAIFVDGCFWHGCPEHATWPKQNAEFWRQKIEANRIGTPIRIRGFAYRAGRCCDSGSTSHRAKAAKPSHRPSPWPGRSAEFRQPSHVQRKTEQEDGRPYGNLERSEAPDLPRSPRAWPTGRGSSAPVGRGRCRLLEAGIELGIAELRDALVHRRGWPRRGTGSHLGDRARRTSHRARRPALHYRAGRLDTLEAFLDAVRWGAATNADRGFLQAPFRSGVSIEDFQLDPLVRAIDMARVNLLIADDVGWARPSRLGWSSRRCCCGTVPAPS
jgi:hypothetical protein